MNFLSQFKDQAELAGIAAATLEQRFEIERIMLDRILSIAPPTAMASEAQAPPLPAGGREPRPPAPLEIAQLLNVFELHGGRVPGFEFVAEGFSIPDLVSRGLIFKSPAHTDGGCYLIGEALRKAVRPL